MTQHNRGQRIEKLLKKAWMDGAKSGTEIAFELVLRSIEGLMKSLGVRRTTKMKRFGGKPPPVSVD